MDKAPTTDHNQNETEIEKKELAKTIFGLTFFCSNYCGDTTLDGGEEFQQFHQYFFFRYYYSQLPNRLNTSPLRSTIIYIYIRRSYTENDIIDVRSNS